MAADILTVRELVAAERGLTVVSTLRDDGSIQASVVNAGVVGHPLTGGDAVGFVAVGGSVKLRNLRRHPRAAVTVRAGFRWVTVEGDAALIGPDDMPAAFDPADLPGLLRTVFLATGSTHDDWPTYDRVMAEERRCVVLVRPSRIYGVG